VELPSQIYLEHLDLDFIIGVRKTPDFLKRIEAIDQARANGSVPLLQRNLKEHLDSICESFARHLEKKGRKDLVKKSVRDVYLPGAVRKAAWAGPAITLLSYLLGQPSYSAMELVNWTGFTADVVLLFDMVFGSFEVRHPSFKNFIYDDLADATSADII
jgi:hypothetical protein